MSTLSLMVLFSWIGTYRYLTHRIGLGTFVLYGTAGLMGLLLALVVMP